MDDQSKQVLESEEPKLSQKTPPKPAATNVIVQEYGVKKESASSKSSSSNDSQSSDDSNEDQSKQAKQKISHKKRGPTKQQEDAKSSAMSRLTFIFKQFKIDMNSLVFSLYKETKNLCLENFKEEALQREEEKEATSGTEKGQSQKKESSSSSSSDSETEDIKSVPVKGRKNLGVQRVQDKKKSDSDDYEDEEQPKKRRGRGRRGRPPKGDHVISKIDGQSSEQVVKVRRPRGPRKPKMSLAPTEGNNESFDQDVVKGRGRRRGRSRGRGKSAIQREEEEDDNNGYHQGNYSQNQSLERKKQDTGVDNINSIEELLAQEVQEKEKGSPPKSKKSDDSDSGDSE